MRSGSTFERRDRLPLDAVHALDGGPYVLVDGTVIADNYAALTSGSLAHAIDQTETGGAPPIEPIFNRAVVWSGTSESGDLQWVEHTCSNWTRSAPDGNAVLGNPVATTNWSFNWGGSPCDRMQALYCFEQ